MFVTNDVGDCIVERQEFDPLKLKDLLHNVFLASCRHLGLPYRSNSAIGKAKCSISHLVKDEDLGNQIVVAPMMIIPRKYASLGD